MRQEKDIVGALCGQGCLDLNDYLPLIGHALLDSLKLLVAADQTLRKNLIEGLSLDAATASRNLFHSPSITTALLPCIGYHKAAELATEMQAKGISITEANANLKMLDPSQLKQRLCPSALLQEGYSVKEIIEGHA